MFTPHSDHGESSAEPDRHSPEQAIGISRSGALQFCSVSSQLAEGKTANTLMQHPNTNPAFHACTLESISLLLSIKSEAKGQNPWQQGRSERPSIHRIFRTDELELTG